MKIRDRIFLVFVLSISAGMFIFSKWISDDLKSRYNESLEEPLVDISHILAENIGRQLILGDINAESLEKDFSRTYLRKFSAKIFELEKTHVDLQVYITDKEGIVLFDSLEPSNVGRDYSAWNDVARTLDGNYGARSSPISELKNSNDESIAFIAAPILIDGKIAGVVSIGKPKKNIKQFLKRARDKQLIIALIIALTTLLLAYWVYRWVSNPLDKLARFANRVSQGERIEAPELGNNEIGDVGRAVQSMREALEGKEYSERYVQTLTHELKSPLSAIRGAVELLSEELPKDQQQRFFKNIENETHRLEDLVERLLQLAGLEKRQSLEDVENVDIEILVKEICEDFAVDISRKNLSLKINIVEDLAIQAERFLVRQALSNLIKNAIEFSPENAAIEISCKHQNQYVEILVSDQGPGIPEYAVDRVFERFYSLPRPSTGQKSTGLGLNFVKEVAELHNGSVEIKRAEHKTLVQLRIQT